MKNSTMLYKKDGSNPIHGGMFDYIIVDSEDIQKAIAEGWHLTTSEAIEEKKEQSRSDLEVIAESKGLKFDGRTSDKKLKEMIASTKGDENGLDKA